MQDHLSVTMLTQNDGVRYATLFGGRKSKFRALVTPWHTGTIWLYEQNPQRSLKITDFDVQKYRHTFRESLYKTQAASLVSELVIKTKGAGDTKKCWVLVNGFLDGLDLVSDDEASPALLRFLWRYLDILGIQPALELCALCGEPLVNERQNAVLFNSAENGFVCPSCAAGMRQTAENDLSLTQEALLYLNAVSTRNARESRRIALSDQAKDSLKRVLFFLISAAAGERLKTLEIAGEQL
jgi:DNA repair protein RecO (recombination protein O)